MTEESTTPAPPFNPNAPIGADKDGVRKINDLQATSRRDMQRCAFAGKLFREYAQMGASMERHAGATVPAVEEFMRGYQQAFLIAAFTMERLAMEKPVYADDEKVGDIAAVLNPVIAALFEAKLHNGRARMDVPALEAIAGTNGG